ncbi:hypothetical protein PIB30_048621 [Stylosanthes scabra]|uniref:Uncharacterized protein n=1 Tax=Stylosanthes scabra TaxID=79078 RepID=A0ABU6THR7_9FABA|nr:hypothetical protein [Stylosanthes scabra]
MDATRQSTPLEMMRLGNRFKDSNRFAFSSTFHKTASTIKAVPFIKTTTSSSFPKKQKTKTTNERRKPSKRNSHSSSLGSETHQPKHEHQLITQNPDEHRSTAHHSEMEMGEHRRSQKQSRRSKRLK